MIYDIYHESLIVDMVQLKRFALLDEILKHTTLDNLIQTNNDWFYFQTISRTSVINFLDKFSETKWTKKINTIRFPVGENSVTLVSKNYKITQDECQEKIDQKIRTFTEACKVHSGEVVV